MSNGVVGVLVAVGVLPLYFIERNRWWLIVVC